MQARETPEEEEAYQAVQSALLNPFACDFCMKPDAPLRCGSCKCKWYCNQECQKNDWVRKLNPVNSEEPHKQACKSIKEFNEQIQAEEKELALYEKKNADMEKEKQSEEDAPICAICLDPLQSDSTNSLQTKESESPDEISVKLRKKVVILPCDHMFCSSCLAEHQISKGHSNPLICPLCRAETSQSYFQYVYVNASHFLRKAKRLDSEFQADSYKHHIDLAKKELSKLDEPTLKFNSVIGTINAELLFLSEKYDEAIEKALLCLESIRKEGEQGREPEILCNHDTVGRCYMAKGLFAEAFKIFQNNIPIFDRAPGQKTITQQRTTYYELSHICYELKQYKKSVFFGEIAVAMNRHYDSAYKYIALSYKELKEYDKAIITLKRSLRYETPWNEINLKRSRDLLELIKKEKNMENNKKMESIDVTDTK